MNAVHRVVFLVVPLLGVCANCGARSMELRADSTVPQAAPSTPVGWPHHAEIVQLGEPVLRERARAVEPAAIGTPEFQALLDRMIRVMREAPGVGLAAPQLGVPLRVFVMEDRPEYLKKQTPLETTERERVAYPVKVWVNPVVTPVGGRRVTFYEGCLSVAGFVGAAERAHEVEVRGLDREGQPQVWRVRGWPARTLQHELDHLEGTVYVDRMLPRSFMEATAAKRRFAGRPIAEILETLGLSKEPSGVAPACGSAADPDPRP